MTGADAGGDEHAKDSTRAADAVAEARPEPRYGVYATYEEQQARIQKRDVTHALETGESLASEAPATAAAAASPASAPARHRLLDRIVTFALLGYGLVNVTAAAVGLFSYAEYAGAVFTLFRIPGEFTDTDSAQLWGAGAAIALIVGFLITAFFAVRRTIAGKAAWWVPLVGAVITQPIAGGLALVPLLSDPAFMAYLSQVG